MSCLFFMSVVFALPWAASVRVNELPLLVTEIGTVPL